MNPLADAESQSSEKAAACPGFRLVSKSSLMSPEMQQTRKNKSVFVQVTLVTLLTSQQLIHLTLYNNVVV